MGLFRRKRDDQSHGAGDGAAADAAPPTFDEIVSPFYAAGDWDGLIGALDRVDPDELDEPEAIRWHTSRGLAAEQSGRRDEAVSAYGEGLRRHPDSSTLHCIRGRLFAEEGRIDEALPHFRSVRLSDGGGSAVESASNYCYLWDALEDAVALRDQIFTAYFSLGIADDHFLYTRGLPFFSEAYGAQAALLVLSGNGTRQGICSSVRRPTCPTCMGPRESASPSRRRWVSRLACSNTWLTRHGPMWRRLCDLPLGGPEGPINAHRRSSGLSQ